MDEQLTAVLTATREMAGADHLVLAASEHGVRGMGSDSVPLLGLSEQGLP